MADHDAILRDPETGRWVRFSQPVEIVQATELDEVGPALEYVQSTVDKDGSTAVGCVAYEAAAAFDDALVTRRSGPFPLLWFGLYSQPAGGGGTCFPSCGDCRVGPWQPSLSWDDYRKLIVRIRARLAAGDTYQVNLTYRLDASFAGDCEALFGRLARSRQGLYGGYLDLGRYAVCSASPELFFELEGDRIRSRPMKGTVHRGTTLEADTRQAEWLTRSEKNCAENVMIVDMIRNDLGRIARPGSIHVPELFRAERYPTVWQMTSTVEAKTDETLPEIFRALFPCASITGAPKANTMGIIASLESRPRGVYCGAMGYLAPGRRARFNVAIRTVTVDREEGRAEYGVGGGIVWDSDAAEEFAECRTKTQVLVTPPPEFDVLETILWGPQDGFFLLDLHLRRALDSCTYFCIPVTRDRLLEAANQAARDLPPVPHKLRMLISLDGDVTVQSAVLDSRGRDRPVRLRWARTPVDSQNPFLYHKTTQRDVYERARASREDCDDVVLWNRRGEATETCIANLVVERDGQLYTPSIESGLLPGTFREWLLQQGTVIEDTVSVEDVMNSPRLYVVNSVRKMTEAVLVDRDPPHGALAD